MGHVLVPSLQHLLRSCCKLCGAGLDGYIAGRNISLSVRVPTPAQQLPNSNTSRRRVFPYTARVLAANLNLTPIRQRRASSASGHGCLAERVNSPAPQSRVGCDPARVALARRHRDPVVLARNVALPSVVATPAVHGVVVGYSASMTLTTRHVFPLGGS